MVDRDPCHARNSFILITLSPSDAVDLRERSLQKPEGWRFESSCARCARLMSTCYRAAGSTAYSRLGALCQVPELTSRRSETASIRFSSESHPDLKSAHVTLTCVAPRAFSRSRVRLSGNRFISSWNSV